MTPAAEDRTEEDLADTADRRWMDRSSTDVSVLRRKRELRYI
jgi:hypothetical protein